MKKILREKYSNPTFFGRNFNHHSPTTTTLDACCEMSFWSTVTCSLRSRSKRASAEGEGRIGVDNPSFSSWFLSGVVSNKGMNGKVCHKNSAFNTFNLFGGFVGSWCCNLFGYKFKHDESYTFAVGHGANRRWLHQLLAKNAPTSSIKSLHLLQVLRQLFRHGRTRSFTNSCLRKEASKGVPSSLFQFPGSLFALRFPAPQVFSEVAWRSRPSCPIALHFFFQRMSKVWPRVCVASQEARRKCQDFLIAHCV